MQLHEVARQGIHCSDFAHQIPISMCKITLTTRWFHAETLLSPREQATLFGE
jgi:hypothetical protein